MAFLNRVRIVGSHRGSVNWKSMKLARLDRTGSGAFALTNYGTIPTFLLLFTPPTGKDGAPMDAAAK